jgi:predicted metal-dependent phosphotriesterase family hydrolase
VKKPPNQKKFLISTHLLDRNWRRAPQRAKKMNPQQLQFLQTAGIDPAQIQALQAQAQAMRAQQSQVPGMNPQQLQFLQAAGIDPNQIQTLRAQAQAQSATGQPQSILLTLNRDGAGGLNLETMQNSSGGPMGGGMIKIPSSFRDVHGLYLLHLSR